MKKSIAGARNGCQMQGAVETIQQIYGAVPIIHSIPGCGISSYLARRSGLVNTGYVEGDEVPSTNVFEKQVIFGGGSRLREQIKNTGKVIKGDLFVVVNSCESSMVGDDVASMVSEAVEQGKKAIHCESTAGFRGTSYTGYVNVLLSLIDQLPALADEKKEIKEKGTVNLFGILPGEDPFFRGNLDVITGLLERIGLHVNRFFGVKDGITELENIGAAELNLVFSKWGVPVGEKLKDKYGTDYLFYSYLPTGPEETEAVLQDITDALKLSSDQLESVIEEEKDRFSYYYGSLWQSFYENNYLKYIGLVGSESTVLQIGGFLKKYVGAQIRFVVITDHFDESETYQKKEDLAELSEEIYYTGDLQEIREIVEGSDIEVLLASSLEREVAEKNHIPLLEISFPIYRQTVLSKTYAGVEGALRLIEDYTSAIVAAGEQKLI